MKLGRFWRYLAPVLVGLLALALWGTAMWRIEAARLGEGLDPGGAAAVRRALLPGPGEIWSAAARDEANLWAATRHTLVAALAGFVAAGLGGYLIGVGLALSRTLKTGVYPWILVVQMTPIVVVAPIIAIWVTRPPLASVVLVTFLLGFFPVVANTLHGFAAVPRRFEELFTVCRASAWQTFWHLRVPHSLPSWFTGLKIAATLAPVGALFADIFVGSIDRAPGLGFQILVYRNTTNTPGLFAVAFVACLMGFGFVGLVRLLRVLCLRRWSESVVSPER